MQGFVNFGVLSVVGSKTIKPIQMGAALDNIIKKFDKISIDSANKGIKKAIVVTWGDIIEQTPVGIIGTAKSPIGSTKGNWLLGKRNTKRTGKSNTRKGREYVRRFFPDKILGGRCFLYNNSAGINMLEYGGYIKNPKLGTYNPKTKKHEIRSVNGFSKQAPRGMVRKNVNRFKKNLKNAFKGK